MIVRIIVPASATDRIGFDMTGLLEKGQPAELLKNVAAPFACAACMAAIVWISYHWLLVHQAQWLRLVINVLIGIVVYCFLIMRFRIAAWLDVRELILETGV